MTYFPESVIIDGVPDCSRIADLLHDRMLQLRRARLGAAGALDGSPAEEALRRRPKTTIWDSFSVLIVAS